MSLFTYGSEKIPQNEGRFTTIELTIFRMFLESLKPKYFRRHLLKAIYLV